MSETFPHAADVAQRETSDNGFSAGNALSHRRAQGVTLTNAELLDRFLAIVARHRGIAFVGAHQLDVSDATLAKHFAAHSNPVCFEAFRCHLRYLKALHLPQDVLDRICWQNARRVFGLAACEGWMTATTRP